MASTSTSESGEEDSGARSHGISGTTADMGPPGCRVLAACAAPSSSCCASFKHSRAGEREVKKALRKTLLGFQLHQDAELFHRAYGYIRQYY